MWNELVKKCAKISASGDWLQSCFSLRAHRTHALCVPSVFPRAIDEPKSRITDVLNSITVDKLRQVYQEFDYRLDA